MPAIVAGLRFPYSRVMLPRTRLAYIHLKNLLTDAKRDRSARLSGYVAVWLPEEFVVLYLQEGEVVNATVLDAKGWRAEAIASALERIPAEPEYGEICFHEADDDLIAAMFAAQTVAAEPWPSDLQFTDPAQLFPWLMSIMFDGVLEIVAEGSVNYLRFRSGAVDKAYLSFAAEGSVIERVAKLFAPGKKTDQGTFRRWSHLEPLPVQAPTALVQAYRDLSNAIVQQLVAQGRESAPAIAEHGRQNLMKKYPELAGFCIGQKPAKEPISDTAKLTAAVATWLTELLMVSADHENAPPDKMLKELTWERRHMFQSAGFFDKMPWKVI
jgi:hypothetical protein